jgi:hypothetical protein
LAGPAVRVGVGLAQGFGIASQRFRIAGLHEPEREALIRGRRC